MKKILFAFFALLALSAPAAALLPTYVSLSTFTPGAANTTPFAFVNHSPDVEVRIQRIELSNCSTGTVTGGIMQFAVFTSTTLTDGSITQSSSYTYAAANAAVPAHVVASLSPTTVQFENKQVTQLPLLRPLYVNDDETATSNLVDFWDARQGSDDSQQIVLPKNANRGIVLQKRPLGGADITDGCVMARVLWTAR